MGFAGMVFSGLSPDVEANYPSAPAARLAAQFDPF